MSAGKVPQFTNADRAGGYALDSGKRLESNVLNQR
jgi:hypothetical protein